MSRSRHSPEERRRWYVSCAAAFVLHAGVVLGLTAFMTAPRGDGGNDQSPIEIAFVPSAMATEADAADGADSRPNSEVASEPPPPVVREPAPEPVAPEAPATATLREAAPAPRSESAPFMPPVPPRRPQRVPDSTAPEDGDARTGTAAPATAGAPADSSSSFREAAAAAPGTGADYVAVLRAWLERHRQYPYLARLRRQEGTATLSFAIDRTGRVLQYRLRRGTGHALLDREVAEMIARAQPLPPVPETLPGTRFEFAVPVVFRLD